MCRGGRVCREILPVLQSEQGPACFALWMQVAQYLPGANPKQPVLPTVSLSLCCSHPLVSQPNGRAKFHPKFSAFIILFSELPETLSPLFLPRDTELNCRVRFEYLESIWFSCVPRARRSDSYSLECAKEQITCQ